MIVYHGFGRKEEIMGDNAKVCPLMSVGRFAPAPCAGKSCAWWNELARMCCMAYGVDCLRCIGDDMEEAMEATKPQGQVRPAAERKAKA